MRSTLSIAVFVLCTLLSLAAAAQDDEPRRYGKFYNGAFVDVSARGALTTRADYSGWSWDIGLRQALVMHLLDTRVSYAEDRWFGNVSSFPGEIVVRSVSIHGAFHPLYMALLYSDWLGYLIASWYVEAGIGGQYAQSGSESDFGLRLSLGSGFDVPITDPDRGWSIWLNALYRYTWNDFDDVPGVFGDFDVKLHHHAGWLGVSLRFNGLLF